MSRLIQGRLAFAAIGCGIIRLAGVVGSPAPMSTVLAGFGVAELGWGVLTLDKLVAPELARMASLAPVIVWAVLVADPGSTISAASMGAMAAFNLVWYALRRLGLRAFFGLPEPQVVPL